MRITREMLLTADRPVDVVPEAFVVECESLAKAKLADAKMFAVWRFEDAPRELRKLCNWNGGDEDWLAVASQEPEYLPIWMERLDTCLEPDVYILNGVVIYVGSHS